jgi:hypothetical protein
MFAFLKRLMGDGPTADKQQGDVHALDREGDPRGGVQDPEYRRADPRAVVEDGVAMSGPAGAPQEDATPDERRAADRSNDGQT